MVMDPVGSVEHGLGTTGLGHDMLEVFIKISRMCRMNAYCSRVTIYPSQAERTNFMYGP